MKPRMTDVVLPPTFEQTASAGRVATIYLRRNGSFGASCGAIRDTGHSISEDSGRFTVWSVHDEEQEICSHATREAAELAIAKDWHAKAGVR